MAFASGFSTIPRFVGIVVKNKVAFLLVTCCLDWSRAAILSQVLDNLHEKLPELKGQLTVFDNASTEFDVNSLTGTYVVHQSDRNVGYWSAVDWWLKSLANDPPDYVYVIESDMMHFDGAFKKICECADYLDANQDVGSVRLHEYSVAQKHLYNKDKPRKDSRRNLWQSHTNRVTGKHVIIDHSSGDIWSTTFLTQVPALNRYGSMVNCFDELSTLASFYESNFQELYWNQHQRTGILDGGIYNCDLNHYGSGAITGSWTDPNELKKLGYQQTRYASIVPREEYKVKRLL